MDTEKNKISTVELSVLFSGLVALIILILIFDKPPFYDEDDYLQNVILLQQYGWGKEYLLSHVGSAGPLYAILHYIFAFVTKLQTPYIRLVNIALLLGSIYWIGSSLKMMSLSKGLAFNALAIPMTYVISGLALTEIPSIFFLSLGIYLVLRATSDNSSYFTSIVTCAFAGLSIGLAILGRQPFLLILAALPILFLSRENYIKSAAFLIITIFFSLALPCYVFYIWNGFVAPQDASLYSEIARKGVSYRPDFFFLCLAYYAITFVIIAPGFYIKLSRKELIMSSVIFMIFIFINHQFRILLFSPFFFLMEALFAKPVIEWFEIIFGSMLFLGSFYFLLTLFMQLHKSRYRKELVFFSAAVILIAISCIKITWGFSSRYPAQAIPLLIPIAAFFYRGSKFNAYRIAIGVVLGLVSFLSYIMLAE